MSAATVFTLEELATEQGDSFEVSTRKEHFKAGEAYHVHIADAELKQTKNGYLQAELKLEMCANGESAGRQWVMLPVFTKEVASTLGQEAMHKKKQVFGKNFLNLLRACDPKQFNAYARIDKTQRQWKFFDEQDRVLSNAEKKQRENAVAARTIEVACAIASGKVKETPLIKSDVWLVITETPSKDASRPEPSRWANWYAQPPEKYPQAAVSEVPF